MNVLPVRVSREVLRHDVSEHVGCREVCSLDGVAFAGITDEVEADADVLGALVELWILCKLYCTLVVDEDLLWLSSLRVVVRAQAVRALFGMLVQHLAIQYASV